MQDNKVTGILFDCRVGDMKSRKMEFFPYGLESLFPNLEMIKISHCGLREIKSEDLKPFLNLKRIFIEGNLIEKIDENLFKFNREISQISFTSNEIFEVDGKVFDGLKLEKVDFTGNFCVRKEFGSVEETIEEVKKNCKVGGLSEGTKKFLTIFSTILITTSVYGLMIGIYLAVLRFKYQKKVKIEIFSELLENES